DYGDVCHVDTELSGKGLQDDLLWSSVDEQDVVAEEHLARPDAEVTENRLEPVGPRHPRLSVGVVDHPDRAPLESVEQNGRVRRQEDLPFEGDLLYLPAEPPLKPGMSVALRLLYAQYGRIVDLHERGEEQIRRLLRSS